VIELTVSNPMVVAPGKFAPTNEEATVPFGGGVLPQQPSATRPNGQAPAARSVQVVTWNTSNINATGNTSHAEHQFVAWLSAREHIMKDIETIFISNFTASPCSECGPELAALLLRIKAVQMEGGQTPRLREATIQWSRWHGSVQPTSWQTLRTMVSAGWKLRAPREATPDGDLPDDVWVYFPLTSQS
jgi:hypothetical protein